jgi:hypothetical protein
MTPQDVSTRLLQHGVRVINVVESLPKTLAGRRIGDQLRGRVSPSAHYEEGRALSRAQTSSQAPDGAEGTARIEQLATPACEGRQDSSRSVVRSCRRIQPTASHVVEGRRNDQGARKGGNIKRISNGKFQMVFSSDIRHLEAFARGHLKFAICPLPFEILSDSDCFI